MTEIQSWICGDNTVDTIQKCESIVPFFFCSPHRDNDMPAALTHKKK
jgi:hypothetical protein